MMKRTQDQINRPWTWGVSVPGLEGRGPGGHCKTQAEAQERMAAEVKRLKPFGTVSGFTGERQLWDR